MKMIYFTLSTILFSLSSFGVEFGFSNIDASDLKAITSESSAGARHSSIGPASRSEKDYGFEFGLVAGDALLKKVYELTYEFASGGSANSMPKVGFLFGLNLPKGFSIESILQPKIGSNIISYSGNTFAIKSNLNAIAELPVQTTIKAHYSISKFNWSQTISSVATDMAFATSTLGLDTQVSKKYGILEPYANLGYSMSTGKMNSNSTATVFDTAYSSGSSAEEKVSGFNYGIGVGTTLMKMNFGFEVMSVYNTSVTAFKASSNF